MNENSEEILEIYKLHAELADRVSQRRLAANRLYVSLLVGLLLFCGALLRMDGETAYVGPFLSIVGSVGVLLAISWRVIVRSYRQLNAGKFKGLRELECALSWQFFQREWEHLGAGKDPGRYRRLSRVEESLPWVFLVVFVGVIGVGLWLWVTNA